MPLRTIHGHNLGALCVIDQKPRTLTTEQRENLQMLADEVVARLELIKRNNELEKSDIFLQNSSNIQAIIDPDTLEILEVNDAAAELFNCSKSELIGRTFGHQITDEKTREKISSFLTQARQSRSVFTAPVKGAEGEQRYFDISYTLHDGCWYMTARDITSREEAHKKFVLEKRFSDAIINNLPGMFCLTDDKGMLQRWNNNFETLTGYSSQELSGSHILNYFTADDPKLLKKTLQHVFAEGHGKAEGVLQTKSGDHIPHTLTGFRFTMEDKAFMIGIGIDISNLQQTQQELRQLLTNKNIGQELAELGSWGWDLRTDQLEWSQKVYDICGIEDINQKPTLSHFIEKIHPDDRQRVQENIAQIREGQPMADIEHRLQQSDGVVKWVRHSGQVRYDAEGNPLEVNGAVQDITEQKTAMEKLEREKELSDKIINSLPISFFMFDQQQNFIRWNDYLRETTGYNDLEISYLSPLDLLPDKHHSRIQNTMREVFKEKEASFQADFVTKDGTTFPYLYTATRFEGDRKTYLIVTGQDISKLQQYQDKLTQSLQEKKVLLAEIHHRVKNNLAIISGLLQLEAFKAEDPDTQKILQNSQLRIQSMATIHEMLYEAESFNNLSFDGFVKKMINATEDTFNQPDLDVTFDLDVNILDLNINQAIPCGLLINELVTNAYKHAFPETKKGTIWITANEIQDEIVIKIKDDGRGLSSDFSLDTASSLGFTLINTLIQQLDADIDIDSQNGTTVTFSFQKEHKKGAGSSLRLKSGDS